MTDYKAMLDEDLKNEFTRLFRNQMYYMAAEGNWSSERAEREENDKEYWACETEMKARGFLEVSNV